MDNILVKYKQAKPLSKSKQKKSQNSKRSLSASSVKASENSQLMSLASLSNTNYLKNVGMLEFVRSSALGNLNKNPIKISIAYKSPEDYHDEILALKKKIRELHSEITSLKFKVRHSDHEVSTKQKFVEELLNNKSNQASFDSNTMINNLRIKLGKVQERYKEKETALNKLQRDVRVTHVQEMEIAIETLSEEILRLNMIHAGGKTHADNKQHKSSEARIKEMTSTILKMSTDKNRLLLENKYLKIDLKNCLEMQKNFKTSLEKERQTAPAIDNNINNNNESKPVAYELGSKSNLNPKISLEYLKKEKELETEVKRMTKVIRKIKEERNFYRDKCKELEKVTRNISNLQNDQQPSGSDSSIIHKTSSKDNSKKSSLNINHAENIIKSNEHSQNKSRKKSFSEDETEFLQSIIRNHKEKHDALYGGPEGDNGSTIAAIELIQAITRNYITK